MKFAIRWNQHFAQYTVSIPSYDGGEVVPASVAAELETELAETRAKLEQAEAGAAALRDALDAANSVFDEMNAVSWSDDSDWTLSSYDDVAERVAETLESTTAGADMLARLAKAEEKLRYVYEQLKSCDDGASPIEAIARRAKKYIERTEAIESERDTARTEADALAATLDELSGSDCEWVSAVATAALSARKGAK